MRLTIVGKHYGQEEGFSHELQCLRTGKEIPATSKLIGLRPWLDEDGVLHANTCLSHAEHILWTTRFAVLLPRRSQVAFQIVKDLHEQSGHGGTNHVLSMLTESYWIPAGRELVREVKGQCTYCRRLEAKPAEQVMAPLPARRVETTYRAFAMTSFGVMQDLSSQSKAEGKLD